MEANRDRPRVVDLFCGAGGLSLGFEQAGFDVVAAVDHDPRHVGAHALNFPQTATIKADITSLSGADIIKIAPQAHDLDVLVGGPPCQGFSVMGRGRPDDPRSALLLEFARLVHELKPSYFVVENVPGLLLSKFDSARHNFERLINGAGYKLVSPVARLSAENFGVPQRRERVFLVGYRADREVPAYPQPSGQPAPTVADAIGDLPNVDDYEDLIRTDRYNGSLGRASNYAAILRGQVRDEADHSNPREISQVLTGCLRTAHTEAVVERFRDTRPGTREPISRFQRLADGGISGTIRAGTPLARGKYTAPRPIHPSQARCITVREAARLQSFPDWFRFDPTKWHGFRQVGNAVPPLLARAVALSLMPHLVR